MISGDRGKAGLLVCDETAGLLSLVPVVSLIHVGEAHSDRVGDGMCRSLAGGFPQALRAVRGFSKTLGVAFVDGFGLVIGMLFSAHRWHEHRRPQVALAMPCSLEASKAGCGLGSLETEF
jgi:hypothetical protein